jgi:trehalose 2-sulfotransferase
MTPAFECGSRIKTVKEFRTMRNQRSYIICTTMRSGSTMLASGLRETGVAGRPDEYFAPPLRIPQAKVFEMEPARYRELLEEHRRTHPADQTLREIIEAGTTDNGVFGVKIHFQRPFSDFHNAVEMLQTRFDDRQASPHELFSRAFPKLSYIWLRRLDRIAQAVSLHKAIISSEFVRVEGTNDPIRPVSEEDFDFDAIQRLSSWLQSGDDGWRGFFRKYRIEPMTIDYEDLAADYEPTLRAVLDYLELSAQCRVIEQTRHRRQADEISEQWAARYREMLA